MAYIKGRARLIFRITDKRGIVLTAEQREQILGCANLQVLNRWFDEAIDAKSADEIFA